MYSVIDAIIAFTLLAVGIAAALLIISQGETWTSKEIMSVKQCLYQHLKSGYLLVLLRQAYSELASNGYLEDMTERALLSLVQSCGGTGFSVNCEEVPAAGLHPSVYIETAQIVIPIPTESGLKQCVLTVYIR